MSTRYKANNKSKAIEVFEGRKKYREDLQTHAVYGDSKYFCDLWHDFSLYGRLDHDGDAVIPKKSSLKPLPIGSKKQRHYVINFVSDMYAGLLRDLKKAEMTGKIPKESVYHRPNIKSAAFPAPAHYKKEIMRTHNSYVDNYLNKHRHVYTATITFEDYVQNFLVYLYTNRQDPNSKEEPAVTKTAVFSNSSLPPNVSGLCIEHDWESGYDKDNDKVKHYFEDSGFIYYKEACLRSGFKIDINAPWRILADLGSPVTQEYMEKYGLSLDNVFQTLYNKVYGDDYSTLQRFLVDSYNMWASTYKMFNQTRTDPKHGKRQSVVRREKVRREEQMTEEKSEMWLEAYVKTRNAECSFPLTDLRTATIISKAVDIGKAIDTAKAVDYINNELRMYSMTSYDFKFNDEPTPPALGTGNIIAPYMSSGDSSGGSTGGSTGGSSGY